jgi:hypothetical protein
VSTPKPATGATVNVGAIVGGVLGGLALIGIIVVVIIVGVIYCWRLRGSTDLHDVGGAKRYYTIPTLFL